MTRLASQCGYALSGEIAVAIIAGPPIAVQIIGEPGAADAAAFDLAERFGVARRAAAPVTPPRNPARQRSWFQPAIDAWRNEQVEALLVIVPPGVLPQWAAQILTALGDVESQGDARCLVLGSDPNLIAALPTGAAFIARDDHPSSQFIAALNRLRAARLLHQLPNGTALLSRPEAISVALRAISTQSKKPCVYLDVADGTTVIVADASGAAVYHDPEIDGARGVIRLLRRCETEQITRWIPFALAPDLLRAWAVRRVSWPMALLTDQEDRAIAAACARASLGQMLGTMTQPIPDGATWMLGPALSSLVSPAALGMVADLMPSVRTAVTACDSDDCIAIIGALSIAYPSDAWSLLAHDAPVPAGSVVQAAVAGGRARNSIAATLADSDGRTRTTDVAANTLTTIACQGPVTLGLTGQTAQGDRIAVHGGAGGILVDTRRRPLAAATPHPPRPNVSGRLRPIVAMDD